MTTHELARQLLAGPDEPVQVQVTAHDAWWGDADSIESEEGITTIHARLAPTEELS